MTDARETAASIFDRTAKLAASLSKGARGTAGTALAAAAGISAAVAGIIRALGVDGAAEAIGELAARRDEGMISKDDIAKDDDSIVDAVSSLYGDDVNEVDAHEE